MESPAEWWDKGLGLLLAAEKLRWNYVSDDGARILAYTGLADPIQMQRETVIIIEELLVRRSDEELRIRPNIGKWSVIEIETHLPDDELVSA